MSAIDDTRKVLQDFLAPELRELKARIEALEVRMSDRFSNVDKRFGHAESFERERFDQAERNAETRHTALIAKIKGLENYADLRERVVKLEVAKDTVHQ
jgi:hypothetical protein